MELNDELLCAYIDGELDAGQRDQIEQALAQDAGGRLRLSRMRAADERLRVEIPVSANAAGDPLARLILRGEAAAPALAARMPVNSWRYGFALAAGCAALALGFVLARVGGNTSSPEIFASKALQSTLERAASGAPLGSEAGAAAIVLTVNTQDGRFCRLYRLRTGVAAGVAEGVACREDGRWRVVGFDATVPSDTGFHTAGASPLLDGVLDRLGGEALAPAAERAALLRNWRGR